MNTIQGFFDRMMRRGNNSTLDNKNITTIGLYDKLKALFESNGAYDNISFLANSLGIEMEAIKPLRNPVNRSVEFYTSRILPNPRIIAVKKDVQDSIDKFLAWSNFSSKKQLICRELSLYGDLFLKVNNTQDKVFFSQIDPRYVTEFECDQRGYLTEIRIDIPTMDDNNRMMNHTEYWNSIEGYFSIWESYNSDMEMETNKLGDPKEFGFLSELGIDFIPIVYIKFRDTGNMRGTGCVTHALDKIDEANRQATILPQRLFRYGKPIWAITSNQVDSSGKPVPAPKINGNTINGTISEKDTSVMYFPGMSDIKSLIPAIPYDAALNILNAQIKELESDLPELRFYSIETNQLSGKAISLLLAGAIERAKEAGNNLKEGLKKLNYMALTIGKFMGIFPMTIGDYATNDFNHDIITDENFSDDLSDRSATLKVLVDSGMGLFTAMKIAGFSDGEIKSAKEEKLGLDTGKVISS